METVRALLYMNFVVCFSAPNETGRNTDKAGSLHGHIPRASTGFSPWAAPPSLCVGQQVSHCIPEQRHGAQFTKLRWRSMFSPGLFCPGVVRIADMKFSRSTSRCQQLYCNCKTSRCLLPCTNGHIPVSLGHIYSFLQIEFSSAITCFSSLRIKGVS